MAKKMMKISKKKGVSPVIATTLLIAMVIIIGLIIFLWFKGLVEERGTKFNKNIQLVCDDVGFQASYSSGTLFVSNIGNIPIFSMKMKVYDSGSGSRTLRDLSTEGINWPSTGLNQGDSFSGSVGLSSSVEKIVLIPVLIGSTSEGDKTFVCEERQGKEILVS